MKKNPDEINRRQVWHSVVTIGSVAALGKLGFATPIQGRPKKDIVIINNWILRHDDLPTPEVANDAL